MSYYRGFSTERRRMAQEMSSRIMVQELAKSGGAVAGEGGGDGGLPARFLQKEENRPVGEFPPAYGIPVIDLRRLTEPGSAEEEAGDLLSALQSWGMFQVMSDEIPQTFLDELRNVAREFFYLPKEDKLKYENLTINGEFKLEGYGNDIVASEDQLRDWNDRLYLLVHPENERSLDLWPNNPINFREVLHEFSIKSRNIANYVLKALEKLLELEENHFTDQFGEDVLAYARFNYYPSCPDPNAAIGMKPHTDGSALTFVLPDENVKGLQVLNDGKWFTVPIVPHALIVNIGDQIEIMSNGILKSPMHRVMANSQERISVAIFYSVNLYKFIQPAGKLVDGLMPKLYKKVMVKDYHDAFFENFAQGKKAIDFAKI